MKVISALIFWQLMPCTHLITTENNVTTLTVLFLKMYAMSQNESEFMVEETEKQMRRDGNLHENLRFKVITHWDCKGSEEKYQFQPVKTAARIYHQEGVDAIIGPNCSPGMISTARLAVEWNIPIIGYLSIRSTLANKNVFKTLSRVSISTDTLGEATVVLIKHFNWTKVGALIDRSNFAAIWNYNAVKRELNKAGIEITVEATVSNKTRSRDIPIAVKQLQENARIIIIQCGFFAKDAAWVMGEIYKANLTNPNYFFILPSGPLGFDGVDGFSLETKKGFENAFVVTAEGLDMQSRQNFQLRMEQAGMPLDSPDLYPDLQSGRDYYTVTHDAFYLYMMIANKLFVSGQTHLLTNGLGFWKYTQNTNFKGASGHVFLDNQADRVPNYFVLSVKDEDVKTALKVAVIQQCLDAHCPRDGIQILGRISYTKVVITLWEDLFDHVTIPRDMPECGYVGELCDKSHLYIGFFLSVLAILVIGLLYFSYRKWKKAQLYRMPWRVQKSSIKELSGGAAVTIGSLLSIATNKSENSRFSNAKMFAVNDVSVTLKKFTQNRPITFGRNILRTLNQIQSLTHENLSNFVGLCFNEKSEFAVIWQNFRRGSLEDIIFNDDISLEDTFKFSFIRDMLKGLRYLHKSPVGVHGYLDVTTCFVDNHWVVKLSGFGLQSVLEDFSSHQEIVYNRDSAYRLLHVAPELLRASQSGQPTKSSKEGDIFSLGTIMYKMFFINDPYNLDKMSPEEILQQIMGGADVYVEFPTENKLDIRLMSLLRRCLSVDVDARPTIKELTLGIDEISPTVGSIVDHMMVMMEKYAGNLEHLVKDRTILLEEARQRADNLLYRMLPKSVADLLKMGEAVLPETFESASVFFCDIVQFTKLCSKSSPLEIVNFMNGLFTEFDAVIDKHDVYKVETIGDAYLVVSGLPKRNGKLHARNIGRMALEMCQEAAKFKIPHFPDKQLEIRCGVHTGPLAAGVVGLAAPRYCIFGDTVNTASRMESSGLPMKIQTTEDTKEMLNGNVDEFRFEERGLIDVKGKGQLRTYWMFGV